MREHDVKIRTEYIKLQELLKFAGVTDTGGEAKQVILEEIVYVNGELCTQRGRKLRVGDKVTVEDLSLTVV